MNEALLIILILITGVTFFNLVKKVGVAAPVIPAMHQNGMINSPENSANVIYSTGNRNADTVYNNLWSVTASADTEHNPLLHTITVVYHQCKVSENASAYVNENPSASHTVFNNTDVCVSSNISDVQYRHVLL